jgi:hypothetical protein
MNRKLLLSLAGAAAGAFLMFGTAQAAPATGALDGLKTLGVEQAQVEQAHWRGRSRWRRCHYRRWSRWGHC